MSASDLDIPPVLLVVAAGHVEPCDDPILAATRALELMRETGALACVQLGDPALVRQAMHRTVARLPRDRWDALLREAPHLLPLSPDDLRLR